MDEISCLAENGSAGEDLAVEATKWNGKDVISSGYSPVVIQAAKSG